MSTAIYPPTALDTVRLDGDIEWVPYGPLNTLASHYIVVPVKQLAAEWTVLMLGTPFNIEGVSYPSQYLVEESPGQYDRGVRRWTRTYMPVFPTFDILEDYSMEFPGRDGNIAASPPELSCASWRKTVTSLLRNEFFMLGVSNMDTYGPTVTDTKIYTIQQIPRLRKLPIINSDGYESNDYSSLVGGGAVRRDVIQGWLSPDAYGWPSTYQTMTNADYLADVAAGVWMVAQDSSVDLIKGKLYRRVTRWVECQ